MSGVLSLLFTSLNSLLPILVPVRFIYRCFFFFISLSFTLRALGATGWGALGEGVKVIWGEADD